MEVVTTLLFCYGIGAAAFQTFISKVLVSNIPVSPPPTSSFQAAQDIIMRYSGYTLDAVMSVYTAALLAFGWSSGFVQAVCPHFYHLFKVCQYGIVNMYYINSFYNKTVPGVIQQLVIASSIFVLLWSYIKRNYFKKGKARDVTSASVQFNYAPQVTLIHQQDTNYFLSSHHIKDRCKIWHDIRMALGSNKQLNLNKMIDQLYNKLEGSEVREFLTELELSQDKIATLHEFKSFVLQAKNAEGKINHSIENTVQQILAWDPIKSTEQFVTFLKFIRTEYYLSVNRGPAYFQSFVLTGPLRFIKNSDRLMEIINDSKLDDINEIAEYLLSDKSRLFQFFKTPHFSSGNNMEVVPKRISFLSIGGEKKVFTCFAQAAFIKNFQVKTHLYMEISDYLVQP
ncbi:hypothetical protein WICMUC_002704 [Wickerhamomyces mucosus]|uniref:Uncharacterized protein n=1 Tax=Wickerhamomyces mucosus TaxID=1378264 RepID=A0A9P8TE18_9ASCO|nr:hypothetical protein WICMUC_002704 [Wickerhamomyces mucosus]